MSYWPPQGGGASGIPGPPGPSQTVADLFPPPFVDNLASKSTFSYPNSTAADTAFPEGDFKVAFFGGGSTPAAASMGIEVDAYGEKAYFLIGTAAGSSAAYSSVNTYTNVRVTVDVNTIEQYVAGSNFRVVWFMFHYVDNWNQYYFYVGMDGTTELGKKQNNVQADSQYFMATPKIKAPVFGIYDHWEFVLKGTHITVAVNGKPIIEVDDNGTIPDSQNGTTDAGGITHTAFIPAQNGTLAGVGKMLLYGERCHCQFKNLMVEPLTVVGEYALRSMYETAETNFDMTQRRANTWPFDEKTGNTCHVITMTGNLVPRGSGSEYRNGIVRISNTINFVVANQTGDYVDVLLAQYTLNNFAATGTIPNATNLKITGPPVVGTNTAITKRRALWVVAGTSTFGGNVELQDSTDQTKIAIFSIASVTTATTRTITIPDASSTMAVLGLAQSWTAIQTHTASITSTMVSGAAIIVNAPTAPVGSSAAYIQTLSQIAGNVDFITNPQTGDFSSAIYGTPTLTNPSSGTITNATTLRINGSPVASTNVTITNARSLWVVGGTSQFDGNITLNARITTNGASSATGSASTYQAIMNRANNTLTFVTNPQTGDYTDFLLGHMTLVNPSSGTITNAATMKIISGPVASTNVTITNKYAFWVLADTAYFQGGVTIDTVGLTINAANIITDTTTGIKIGTATTQKIGVFNATPVVQQTDGAALVNNATVNGTTNQIDDFAGTLYATDGPIIQRDIYQLARKVKIMDDALRLFGWLS